MGATPERVLLLDAHRTHSRSFARSMSEHGVGVTAGCRSQLAPAMFSKFVDDRYIHPDHTDNPERFVDHLVQFLEQNPHRGRS